MADYYGLEPSSDFFAHYGVKGMKWGVRKALEKSGPARQKSLERQYRKAQRKLYRLNQKADLGVQKAKTSKALKRAAIGTGVAGLGLGASIGFKRNSAESVQKAFSPVFEKIRPIGGKSIAVSTKPSVIKEKVLTEKILPETMIREKQLPGQNVHTWDNSVTTWDNSVKRTGSTIGSSTTGEHIRNANRQSRVSKVTKVAGLGALGYAGYNAGKAAVSAYRQSSKGHAKAVAKRNAWQKEMKSAFKGTKYANLPPYAEKRRKTK